MTMFQHPDPLTLSEAVAHPHGPALEALDGDGSSLVAVTWLAAHLAAVDRILHPAIRHHLPEGRDRVRLLRGRDHRLQQMLWRLDRCLTGDLHQGAWSVQSVEQEVRDLLESHAAAEHRATAELEEVLSEPDCAVLTGRLAMAMLRAPTRPHPSTPHLPFAGALTFRVEALADRGRELMDNRSIPVPHRERPPVPLSRWGSYLTASPYPPAPRRAERDDSEPATGNRR